MEIPAMKTAVQPGTPSAPTGTTCRILPPLGVIGIALATARWPAAWGATLLFGTNLIAISLAAAVVYLLLGFFPQAEERARHVVLRRGFLLSLALLFVITIPLARRLEQDVTRATLGRTLRSSVEATLNEDPNLSLFNFDWRAPPGQPVTLRIVVFAAGEVEPNTVERIDETLTEAVGREVHVRLVIIRASELSDVEAGRP